MAENIAPPFAIGKPERPFGIWIFTIYALIFAGIAPLLLSIFLLFSGNTGGNTIGILFSIPLSIGVIITAIGAWQGNASSRKLLLILITLNYALIGINNFLELSFGEVPVEQVSRFWGRVLRGILYPAVYLWYFNRATTKAFYGLNR